MLPVVDAFAGKGANYLLFRINDVVTNGIRVNGDWDPHLHTITHFFTIDILEPLVLDIGANLGGYAIPVGKMLQQKGGTLLAFEPQRIIYYQLCGNIFLNSLDNVFALNVAVGDHDGLIDMPVPDYNNMINIGGYSLDQQVRDTNGLSARMSGHSERIPMMSLDSYVLPKPPAFIKLDVEGYELNVLRGGEKFLRNNGFPPIYFEMWEEDWYAERRADLLDFLFGLGYEITKVTKIDYVAQHPVNPVYVRIETLPDGRCVLERVR